MSVETWIGLGAWIVIVALLAYGEHKDAEEPGVTALRKRKAKDWKGEPPAAA